MSPKIPIVCHTCKKKAMGHRNPFATHRYCSQKCFREGAKSSNRTSPYSAANHEFFDEKLEKLFK